MASSSTRSSARRSAGNRPLSQAFYERHTLEVARDLLGKILVVQADGKTAVSGRIVETEAYRADDPASHSYRGPTPRAAIMFGPPGVAYVYFIYGMYEMLNFVTEPSGQAGAVLIRAIEPLSGLSVMRRRRPAAKRDHELASGPGKLCRAMAIRMSHNGTSLASKKLFVTDDGFRAERILVSPRVGINVGIDKMWRFYLADNPNVSRAKENTMGVPVEELAF